MNSPNIEAVLNLVNGNSNKYVPAPPHRLIQAVLLIGLHQFKNSVTWKGFWLNNEDIISEMEYEEEEDYFDS